jgi:hypothetical protein
MKNLNQKNISETLNNLINQEELNKFNLKNYLKQASTDEVKFWINHNLQNYLKKHQDKANKPETISEIEHIIDYLNSDSAPLRLQKMSYNQAKNNADKWLKTQIKKGKTINEVKADIEVFMEFENGFKMVKLVGQNAYKREGFLMGHCVGSYFDKSSSSIYSLRDNQNNPHATIELYYSNSSINQVKGKGNGSIHPAYINYLLEFFAKINLQVRSSELYNLGYKKIDQTTFELIQDIEGLKFLERDDDQYLFMHSQLSV